MKRYVILFSFPCLLIIPIILYQTPIYQSTTIKPVRLFLPTDQLSAKCIDLLLGLETNIESLLLDEPLLGLIESGKCGDQIDFKKPIKIGIDIKLLSDTDILQDKRFEVIYYSTDPKSDYFDLRTEPRKIIPKNFNTTKIGQIAVPKNIRQFLGFLQRSKFIECLNLFIPRPGQKVRLLGRQAAGSLAILRDRLLQFGIFPFLNGGSLLGWYRECSVIPHTNDLDLAVFHEDFNPNFIDFLESNQSDFRLRRKFGMLNDSFEMTVSLKKGYSVVTDIFVMYSDKLQNGTVHNWVGGVDKNGNKYKFSYPKYDPWCAADLFGHIFWVTCSPKEMLRFEYGELWYQDHPTNRFVWYKSGRNVQANGKWTAEQMKTVYFVQ